MEILEQPQSSELIALENQYGAHNYYPLDVVIERAEGVWVYDVEGIATSIASPPTPPSIRDTAILKF